MNSQLVDGVPTVTPQDTKNLLGKARIIDVRRPEEFTGELGHIPGSELCTLGDEFMQFLISEDKSQEIIFVCRSGARSANATMAALEKGFTSVANMSGGMIQWNELKFETER